MTCPHVLLLVTLAATSACVTASLPVDDDPQYDVDGGIPVEAPAPDAEPVEACATTLLNSADRLVQDDRGQTTYTGGNVRRWSVSAFLEDEVEWTVAIFDLHLFKYRGTFFDGLGIGTYPIESDDTTYETCALCAFVRVTKYDVDPYEQYHFMAQGGTLRITELDDDGEILHGTLEGVTFAPFLTTNTGKTCVDSDDCTGASLCHSDIKKCSVSTPVDDVCSATFDVIEF